MRSINPSPFIIFVTIQWTLSNMSMSLALGSPEQDTAVQLWPHRALSKGKGPPASTCWQTGKPFLMQLRTPLTFLVATTHHWLMVNVVSTRMRMSLFCQAAFQLCSSQPVLVHGVVLPQGQDVALPFFNFMRSLSACCFSLSRSIQMAAQTSGLSSSPPSVVSWAALLRVHSTPSSRLQQSFWYYLPPRIFLYLS